MVTHDMNTLSTLMVTYDPVTADANTEIAWVDFMLFMIALAIRF
jgi:hypothetical protein